MVRPRTLTITITSPHQFAAGLRQTLIAHRPNMTRRKRKNPPPQQPPEIESTPADARQAALMGKIILQLSGLTERMTALEQLPLHTAPAAAAQPDAVPPTLSTAAFPEQQQSKNE